MLFDVGVQYLIKWKGFSMEQTTWEPKAHLAHLKQDIANFEREFKMKQSKAKANIPKKRLRMKN
jgi:hypothetical protein